MLRRAIFTLTLLTTSFLPPTSSLAQSVGKLRIAELNCENLFDTIHTEGHNDHEFLPTSQRRWTAGRYHRKLSMLAREIASLGQTEPADLVALVEVEGDTALTDLTMRTRLRTLHYNYIVTHGSDPRGINVALLWQEGAFRPLHTHTLCWQQRLGVEAPTRDVLHVQGLARSGDTLDVIVCHMPSQYGKRHSKRLRSAIAKGLRDYTDSLLSANPRANIIILGDMNDSPQSRPMRRALGATVLDEKVREFQSYNVPKFERNALFNISLLRSDPHHPRGTYRYKGNWEMLDQCIVSGRLLDTRSHLHVATTPVRIVSHDFLLEGDKSYGGVKPWRTWQGPMFRGGFSDHLPIVVEFEYER
ncbi:MAG: endonuclease [Bacteroidaceae bacterium]|nr:endonuclease [Bacteroidaceae bacterium]